MLALSGLGSKNDVLRMKRGRWNKKVWETLIYNLIFLNNFLLGYTKNAYNQRGFSKPYLHNKANADNQTIRNAFSNGWL